MLPVLSPSYSRFRPSAERSRLVAEASSPKPKLEGFGSTERLLRGEGEERSEHIDILEKCAEMEPGSGGLGQNAYIF